MLCIAKRKKGRFPFPAQKSVSSLFSPGKVSFFFLFFFFFFIPLCEREKEALFARNATRETWTWKKKCLWLFGASYRSRVCVRLCYMTATTFLRAQSHFMLSTEGNLYVLPSEFVCIYTYTQSDEFYMCRFKTSYTYT